MMVQKYYSRLNYINSEAQFEKFCQLQPMKTEEILNTLVLLLPDQVVDNSQLKDYEFEHQTFVSNRVFGKTKEIGVLRVKKVKTHFLYGKVK
mgnify:CR=1 FL=1